MPDASLAALLAYIGASPLGWGLTALLAIGSALLVVVVVGPLALLIVGPLLVKRSLKPLVSAEIEPDPIDPPADVRLHFEAATAAFAKVGFKPAGRYLVRTELGGNQARMLLFRGANGASLGYAAALPRAADHLLYCEIGTSFEDGTSVTVGNASAIGPFKPMPGSVTLQLPQIAEAHALWDIHRAVVGARKAGLRAKRVGAGEEVAAVGEGVGRSAAYQVQCGFLTREAGGRFYALTWLGAFRFTWLSVPPFGPLREKLIRRRDAALMAELGATRVVAA